MSNIDEIDKLHELREKGAITDAEFEKMKRELIEKGSTPAFTTKFENATKDVKVNDWAMFMHLSQLAGVILPGLGYVVPLVLWFMKKDESAELDRHGRVIINWMISALIYSFICGILIFVIIGIPMLMVLGLICIVFPIIGAIKAKEGKLWIYPMSIKFMILYK